MHSWRVLLLPFIEETELYEHYNFDEPWNSRANIAICTGGTPLVYQCPDDPGGDRYRLNPTGHCSYFMVNIPDGIVEGDTSATLDEIPDGPSNTIMVVEVAGSNIHWAEPRDLGPEAFDMPINLVRNGTSISSHHHGGAHVLFADGRVRILPNDTAIKVLQSLLTKSDGQIVELE
jgi:prepilin-type processing-associated H-X9-DG protein